MHAYLIVGRDKKKSLKKAEDLAVKLKSLLYEFEISKIQDVRFLQKFVKFKLTKPTTFLIRNVEKATTEALNAFLKNLEEPQKNAYYILTASSSYKLLPTVVSRCQIIKIPNSKFQIPNAEELNDFLNMSVGKKFKFIERYKKREDATTFIQEFIHFAHEKLIKSEQKVKYAKLLELAQDTLNAISANGNVSLQLTSFSVNI